MLKLKKVLKDKNISLIHSNSRTTQVLGCLLHRSTGIYHISTCHGFFKRRLSRRVFPCWGQKVIAISEAVKEHLSKDFGVGEENIAVIHNGIEVDKSEVISQKSEVRIKEKLGLGAGPIVGIVARLSDVKGHIYLIQAMKKVLETIPSAQLLVCGEGKMESELIKLTGKLGIEKNVVFIRSASTAEILSVLDLFVMPSLKEGLGLALMEAMAFGLAVIGSNVGGIKSLISDGYSGLLVSPKDAAGLSKAILELLQDAQRRESLARNGQAFICKNFSLDKMIQQTEGVYLECLSAKS